MKKFNDLELDLTTHAAIVSRSEKGNNFMDQGNYRLAIQGFLEAYRLLPEPKIQWDAATWLLASLGDAYYQDMQFENAKLSLLDSLNCPDGSTNPFILLRLGESCYRCGELDSAKEYLTRAYMLEGVKLFEEEPAEILDLVLQTPL